jgi:hypothetical protein
MFICPQPTALSIRHHTWLQSRHAIASTALAMLYICARHGLDNSLEADILIGRFRAAASKYKWATHLGQNKRSIAYLIYHTLTTPLPSPSPSQYRI